MKISIVAIGLAVTLHAQTTIEVDASKPAAYQIPRAIYGTFLEPIGNSTYNGLWAEILENPSFEENLWSAAGIRRMTEAEPSLVRSSQMGLPLPWEPLDYSQGSRYEPRWNDAANSARSLLVMALPGKQTGVRQRVYLPAYRTLKYIGSLYVKHVGGPPEVEVSLRGRNRPDKIFARQQIHLTGPNWARYDFKLDVPAGQIAPLEPADFVIALSDESRALIDEAALLPADNVDGLDREMVDLSRNLKTPIVRFGGNFTSAYHWRDGIGPPDKRVGMLNIAWGIPEYNTFGTDEFLRFCQLIDAQPQIALNLGTGSPGEAADWVRYVNGHWGDKSGGLLWELGNELWGDFQIGYPTLARVAARTKEFADAIHGVDKRARLIATGADPDRFHDWNAAQLANAADFNFLSTHFVVRDDGVRRKDPSPEFLAESSLALPVELERRLRDMEAQIDADPQAKGRVNIAFTEWLFHGQPDRVPQFSNLGGALCTAGFLNTLMRVANFTQVSDMTGLIEFGGIWKKRGRVYAVPAYWAFRMYSNADAVTPVETRNSVETYDIHDGNTRLPEIEKVPYLDVVSAVNRGGDKLTMFCVNRHLDRDLPAQIHVAGFPLAKRARIQTLSGLSIYQTNDEMRPEAVHPVEIGMEIAGAQFTYTFPRASVTVIELNRK
ncbi:MAG: alpha-L-arabinofuranosidase C-terminal domain-containing protein [Bryobacteraceae bacterium]